jgi:hypothetical protein
VEAERAGDLPDFPAVGVGDTGAGDRMFEVGEVIEDGALEEGPRPVVLFLVVFLRSVGRGRPIDPRS